jgi:hypothetical protein
MHSISKSVFLERYWLIVWNVLLEVSALKRLASGGFISFITIRGYVKFIHPMDKDTS